jgi:hypothetical protein
MVCRMNQKWLSAVFLSCLFISKFHQDSFHGLFTLNL